ncbi:ETS homologous factor-like isoform X4 [Amblyomma americanum]
MLPYVGWRRRQMGAPTDRHRARPGVGDSSPLLCVPQTEGHQRGVGSRGFNAAMALLPLPKLLLPPTVRRPDHRPVVFSYGTPMRRIVEAESDPTVASTTRTPGRKVSALVRGLLGAVREAVPTELLMTCSSSASLVRISRVQSRTQNLAYRMMLNQADLMGTHESPFSPEEQFMYDPSEEDKNANAYCSLQPIGLDAADHVTSSLQHMDPLMVPSSRQPYEGDTFPTEMLDLGGSRWQSLSIQHWQSQEVLDWLEAWASHNGLEIVDEDINMIAFASLTGEHLCRMSLDDFRAHAPSYGHRLYDEVQRLLGNSAAASRNGMGMPDAYYEPDKYAFHPRYFDTLEIQNSSPGSENALASASLRLLCLPVTSSGSPGLAESDSASTSSSLSTVNERTENLFPYMPHDTRILAKQMPPPMPMMGKKKGRRGRPPIKEAKVRSRAGKGMGKLWEFIRDLLLNPSTNPSLIRWERREDGIFKFVQSDKVAKMWGDRKQNPRMTYEKLSRAMRYYYKSQVLLPVFGRRLVYKFGPNATGWRP